MVLKELCALRGVSGDEGRVREYIRRHVESCATSVTVDRMGNLIAHKKGTGAQSRHIVLSAHMDEVGMVVKGICDDKTGAEKGLIRYETAGSIDPRTVVSKPVRIGDAETPGVIGAKAIHLQSAEDREKMLPHDKLSIDVGAKNQASAEALAALGDTVTFESRWVEFGDGLVKSRALDSRIGCMVMMSILEGEYPCDVTCVFTVQEEIGSRGAAAAAYGVESDAAIILNASIANDLGADPGETQVSALKKGVALSFMDRSAIASIPLYARLRELAIEKEIPWQISRMPAGQSDAGAFQRAAGDRAVCVLSVPCRYMHTPSCVAAFADIEAQYRLVDAFLTAGGAF